MSTQPDTSPTAFKVLGHPTTTSVDLFVQLPMSMTIVPEITVCAGLPIKLLLVMMAAVQRGLQIKVLTMQAQNLMTGGRINLLTAARTAPLLDNLIATWDTTTVGKHPLPLVKPTTPCRGFGTRP